MLPNTLLVSELAGVSSAVPAHLGPLLPQLGGQRVVVALEPLALSYQGRSSRGVNQRHGGCGQVQEISSGGLGGAATNPMSPAAAGGGSARIAAVSRASL